MRAVALTACVLGALPCARVAAQDAPGLSERLGFEGPLDNDTARPCNDAATRVLASIERGARTDAALEAARRALVESAPGDASCSDPRRSRGIERAVRAAIADPAAFGARFEALATAALDDAGYDERALERVEHENPFTGAGARASLRRFDLLYERGARAAARAALDRARANAPVGKDPQLESALSARFAALGTAQPSDAEVANALDGAQRLRHTATIELDPQGSDDPSWRLLPSAAVGADGRAWIQSGENLVVLDERSKARTYAPAELCAELGATWVPAFGDADKAWLQRPALAGADRLVLVVGRAKETRGNALCVLDVGGAAPRARWVHSDRGFAHQDGTRAEQDQALLQGRLEFQPGPVVCEGLVIAQVLQWHQPAEPASAQSIEAAKTSAWLVALDERSGRVEWMRRIATGADRRARGASRFAGERGLSCVAPPLAISGTEVLVATELGVFARHSALDGVLHASWKTRRARAAEPPGFGGPFSIRREKGGAGSFAVACADSGGIVYFDGEGEVPAPGRDFARIDGPVFGRIDGPAFVRIDGVERLVAADSDSATVMVLSGGRRSLQRVGFRSGRSQASIPLPRGAAWQGSVGSRNAILCAFEGRVCLFDLRADLALVARIDLPGLASEGECGLLVHQTKAYVLGTRRAWVLALE